MKAAALIILTVFAMITLNSCATWSGIKYDSKKAWSATKKTIHDATAD